MKINNKYNIGDKLFCIRNNKIEKVEIDNFILDGDKKLSLNDRLRYSIKTTYDALQTQVLFNIYIKNVFKESELFRTIAELLESIKNNYKNNVGN